MGKFSVIVSWIPFFGHEWLLQGQGFKGGMMAGGVHGGWRRATAELITHCSPFLLGHGQGLLCGHETHLGGAVHGRVKVNMPASASTRAEETGGDEDLEK